MSRGKSPQKSMCDGGRGTCMVAYWLRNRHLIEVSVTSPDSMSLRIRLRFIKSPVLSN